MHYRKIWESTFGPIPKDEQGRSYEIHHVDGDSSNNSLNNLVCISIQEHYNIHYKQEDWFAAHMIGERLNISEEERLFINSKISEARKGKKHSEETKQKMREVRLGKVHSENTKRKMSEAKKGKPGNKRSEESRRKITEALKKRIRKPVSKETKQKMREAKLGKSSGMKGKIMSEEVKQKIRDSLAKTRALNKLVC